MKRTIPSSRTKLYALNVPKVRELLTERGESQAWLRRQLAARGCAGSRLEMFEDGRNTNPSLDVVASMADILGVDIDTIVLKRGQ